MFRVLYLTIRFFTEKRVTAQAAALTYSTLLSMVPILAVVFAIARGFGYSKYIELWFRKMMSTQPQIADLIVDFVNRYLAHTQSGIFLGIGLLFMLFTVLMLVNNIEETFNEIWQVSNARPIMRSIVNYLAMFFVFPIIIIVSMGLSIFMATVADVIEDFKLLSSAVHQLFDLSNSLLMSLLFILLYVYMPNTKVKWSCAMLWMQISWTICLFGAQLTYTNQNLNRYGINLEPIDIHPKIDMSDDERDEAATQLYSDRLDSL